MRLPAHGWAGAALIVLLGTLLFAGTATAAPPAAPTITEPAADGQIDSPADVHMEVDGGAFSDPDGDPLECTDWEIWTVGSPEKVWQAPCVSDPVLRVHIHLGDGSFLGSYAGRSSIKFDTAYRVMARFKSGGEYGPYASRDFRSDVQGPTGVSSEVPWALRQPGFTIEKVATGFQLPVDIAFVPQSRAGPGVPAFYVSELYGKIEAVSRPGSVSDYATGLLNFDPTGSFPGSGEQGVTGLAVDPASGDLFASMVYDGGDGNHYDKVVRFHSDDGGWTAGAQQTILDSYPDWTGPSHQVSNLTIGPDGKLYVHIGDGLRSPTPAPDTSLNLGKIMRINLDGSVPTDNPLYDASDGITATDRILAYGFRNPFGGAWRASNGALYEVENGPSSNDRLARINAPGLGAVNYGWNGTASSMLTNALYTWSPTVAPVDLAFVQPQTFSGSGFPAASMDHAFVTESGPTYATGPQLRGKRIVELAPGPSGELGERVASTLVEYVGTGKATVAGIAAGPDGLYFTDLYKDQGASSAIDPGANVWRIRYLPPSPGANPPAGQPATNGKAFDLKAAKRRCRKKHRGRARARCIKRARKKAGAL